MGVVREAGKWGARALLLKVAGPVLAVGAALTLVLGLVVGVLVLGGSPGDPNEAAGNPCAAPGTGGGGEPVAKGKVPKPEWEKEIISASKVAELSSPLLAAQLDTESQWNPNAVSHVGAQGLAQFMPDTWAKYSHGKPATDPIASIRAQGEYLRDLRKEVAGVAKSSKSSEADLMFAAYNAGPGAVQAAGGVPDYEETRNYVAKINELAKSYEAEGIGGDKPSKDKEKKDEKPADDECGGGSYSGGKTSGNDDYPWRGQTVGVHAESGFYYGQCTDFAWWRLNQQMGGDAKNAVVKNTDFPPRLGDGGQWAAGWRARGWPVDHTPEVGAMANFGPGVSGADPTYGHIAVVKEVKGDKVVIEEYNGLVPSGYGTRELPVSGVSWYLHIPDDQKKNKAKK